MHIYVNTGTNTWLCICLSLVTRKLSHSACHKQYNFMVLRWRILCARALDCWWIPYFSWLVENYLLIVWVNDEPRVPLLFLPEKMLHWLVLNINVIQSRVTWENSLNKNKPMSFLWRILCCLLVLVKQV